MTRAALDKLYLDRHMLASRFLTEWLVTEIINTDGDSVLEYFREESDSFANLDYEDQCYLADVIVDICRQGSIEVSV